jgi:hypothetical protein
MQRPGLVGGVALFIACAATSLAVAGCGSSNKTRSVIPSEDSGAGSPGLDASSGSGGTNGGGGSAGGDSGNKAGSTSSGGSQSSDAGPDASNGGAPGDGGETTAPVNLGSTSGGPVVGAASLDGSAMLVIQTVGATSELLFSHYEVLSGWSTPASVPGTANAALPQIGIDDAGNTFVAWQCNAEAGHALCVMRYDHGKSSWETARVVDAYSQFSTGFAFGVSHTGDALAIYLHQGSSGPHDVVAQHYSGGTWKEETVATEAATVGVTNAVVSMAAGGLAVAAFNTSTGLNVATRSGAGWTVASSTLPSADIELGATINDAGEVLVAFTDAGTVPKTYQYDAITKKWSGPTARGTAGETQIYGTCPLTVALSTNGDGTVARCFSGGNPRTIEAYAYTKSTNAWGNAVNVPGVGWPFFVSFAFDSAGDCITAFVSSPNSSTPSAPAVSSSYSNGAWSAASAPLGGVVSAYSTASFISPNGRGWVAWNEGPSAVVKRVR